MALEVHDRVKETTTTTGSSDAYALGGAVTGFETFGSHLGNADTTYYVCTDGTNFEIGRGTYNTSGNTLTRTEILASSNSGNDNAHSWASGTKEIFITYPSSKAVFKDASNNINGTFVGDITGNVTGNTSGSSGSTTGNAATATALQTARAINGTNFDGTGDITVTAAAGTLTGSTLNSGVTASSLTSLGTLASDLNMGGQDIINTGVSSADTHAGEYGSSSSPITFTVTVASKSGHPYQGDGSGLGYVINGVQAPALTLHGVDNVTSDSGYYYRFDQSDSSNSGHPLAFYLDADKSTAYTTGVTDSTQLGSPISPGSSGAYTQIYVNEDTPNILYYQCTQHAYMGNHAIVLGSNKINHTEALLSFPTTTGTLVGTGDTGSVSNTMLAGSIANDKLAGSIANAKLANSSITVADGSSSTAVALGGTITFAGTSNEVEVGESSGTITVGLPDNVTIAGNLTVNGTTTTIDTTNTLVKDSLLGLNNGASSNSNDSGIIIERGSTGNDALLIWDESADKWALGTTTSNASSTGNLNMTTGTLVANIEGDVTGNADTATTATNATHVTVTDNESTSETNLITFVENAQSGTGNHGLEMDGNLSYGPSDGRFSAPILQSLNANLQSNLIFTNTSGQLCFGMDGSTSNVVLVLDDEDGQPIFTFSEEGGTAILDGGDTDVTSHKPFIANSTITASGRIIVDDTTDATSTTDGSLQTDGGLSVAKNAIIGVDLKVGDDLVLNSDAGRIFFGSDLEVVLTHVHNTGLKLNSSKQLQFGDDGTYIHQSADGVLDLVSDTEIELNATTVDINGAVDISGNTDVAGTLTSTGNFDVNTNKFTVNASSGNTAVAGTLTVGGDNVLTSSTGATKGFATAMAIAL